MKPVIDFTLAGIPCLIKVNRFYEQRGSHSYNAPSDMDYYGYYEMDYTILDRRGYTARWLERKITDRIEADIEHTIIDYFTME